MVSPPSAARARDFEVRIPSHRAERGWVAKAAHTPSSGWVAETARPEPIDATQAVSVILPPGERLIAVEAMPEGVPGGDRSGGTRPARPGARAWAEVAGTGVWQGYALGSILIHPAPASSPSAPGLRLLIHIAPAGAPATRRSRSSPEQEARMRSQLRDLVVNPEAIDSWAPPASAGTSKPAGRRGFHPSSYPDLEGSPVRYLIVTSSALAADFQVLADWKTRRGVPAQVRTLDWVAAHARRGSDLAETLRNFIQDAYALWGVDWVLLGGDTDVVPVRYAYSNFSSSKTIPTDLYYACLDGDWNANHNSLWAEAATSPTALGDEADLYPEIFVSRAPVQTSAQAQLFVQKTVRYETPIATGYQNRALMLAEVLSPAAYDSGQAINLDGSSLSEQVRNSSMPGSLDIARLYETYYMYPGSGRLRKSVALDSLRAGPNLVNHVGHGYIYNMSMGDASIVSAEAKALDNGDRTFVMFLLNCTALAFDSNSLGEQYVLAPGGGAVGVVGSSREAFPTNSVEYNKNFFSEIFAHGHPHLGEAVAGCRQPRTPFTFFDTQDRWTHFILNVLGDPELTIYTGPTRLATVTHADSVDLSATNVAVHVEAGGTPVDSVRVCAWKGDESYAYGLTDAGGNVTLALTLDTPGTILVTASQRNLITYLGSIAARVPAPAHVRIASSSTVDDGSAGTSGNGDGIPDAGETVQIVLQVANSGGATATGAWARIVSNDVRAVVLGDSIPLGDLPASPTPTASGSFRLQLAATIPDGSVFPLQVQFKNGSGAAIDTEIETKVVRAPRYEVVELLTSPAGGGTDIRPRLTNFGGGRLPSGSIVLTTSDPDVTVLQDTTSFASIASFATGTSVGALRVSEANTTQRNRMRLTLTDGYGRTQQFDFDLRGPGSAAKPALDASTGPTQMKLTWTPSTDTDLLGYHVYRRLAGTGSLVRVTTDVVHSAYDLDTGLSGSTRYDYAVAAVDSSGLVGPQSIIATASTNPPQLAGWPVQMAASTSSSVAIGDIDGDGKMEIVVGDDHVYAWHGNAIEVRDGDNNPVTWGVMQLETITFAASVALGDLDKSRPGLEIVAASWNDNRVFAYDGAGNVLPGWPRQPSNGGTPGFWGSPSVADLDGDGSPEVLAVSKDGHLYGWHANGTPLVGAQGDFGSVGAFTRTTPAIANLDGDPNLEILVAGATGYLYAFNVNGTPVTGPKAAWPKNLGAISLSSPAVGEIDGIGRTTEIVVTSENSQVHKLDANGVEFPGWPKSAPMKSPSFGPSPALADLNGDGKAEIVVVSNANPAILSSLIVYDGATSNVLLNKLLTNSSESSPILADVDGDGSIDIVVGGESGIINAWKLNGNPIDGFPLTVGDFVRGTPAFADVDENGTAELVLAGWDHNLYVWNLGVPYTAARAPWPTFCHDMARTGNAIRVPVSDAGDGLATAPARFHVWQNAPNPFNPATSIRFETPRSGAARVEIFDTRGHLVRALHRGLLAAGAHRLEWDGRDAHGRPMATGIYWYRVEAAGQTATRKMVLLK